MTRVVLLSAIVLLGALACELPPGSAYGRACDDDDDCGDGFICHQATCVPESFDLRPVDAGGHDASVPVDGGRPDAGGEVDAGPPADDGGSAGVDGGVDGGSVIDDDAGADDAGPDDAGPHDAGGDDGGLADGGSGDAGEGYDAGPEGTCARPTIAAIGLNTGDTSSLPAGLEHACFSFNPDLMRGLGPEQVFQVTVPGSGVGRLTALLSSSADLGLYLTRDCAGEEPFVCAENNPAGTSETLSATVSGGDVLHLVVDGFEPTSASTFNVSLAYLESVCGNGLVEPGEECDDDDTAPDDGCSASCRVEACLSPIAAVEGPNGGDTSAGDDFLRGSCLFSGTREQVWSYLVPGASGSGGRLHATLASATDHGFYVRTPSTCGGTTSTTCVNDVDEGQDEQAVLDVFGGDEVIFVVEAAASGAEGPYTLTLDHVPAECGNADVEPGEQCDDDNTSPGDGCDGSCQKEPAFSCDGAVTATLVDGGALLSGDTSAGVDVMEGSCVYSTGGKERVVRLDAPAAGTLYATLTPTTGADLALYAREVCTESAELGCVDSVGVERTRYAIDEAGGVFLVVDGRNAGQAGAYELALDFVEAACGNNHVDPLEQCDPGEAAVVGCDDQCQALLTEQEPNDDNSTANVYVAPFVGFLDDDPRDIDRVTVTVTDEYTTLTALVSDLSGGAQCANDLAMRAQVSIYGPTGLHLGTGFRNGPGQCSVANARGVGPGTYVVQVANSLSTIPAPDVAYRLDITTRLPVCGDGIRDPGEHCELPLDDGDGGVSDAGPAEGLECTAECLWPVVAEQEPNDDGSPSVGGFGEKGNDFDAAAAEGPFSSDIALSGALTPAGDEDVFAVFNPSAAPVTVTASTFAPGGPEVACAISTLDTMLVLRDGSTLVDDDDESGPGSCSTLTFVLGPGETRYVHVIDYGDNSAIDGYLLTLDFSAP